MITKNKSLIALFLTFGALAPCNLLGYFINISVLGNRETKDIVVLVGDVHIALASFEEDLQQIEVIARGAKKADCVGREADMFVESVNLHGQTLTRNFFEVEKLVRFRAIENQYREFLESIKNGGGGGSSPYPMNIELPRQLTLALEAGFHTHVKGVDPRLELEAIGTVVVKSPSPTLFQTVEEVAREVLKSLFPTFGFDHSSFYKVRRDYLKGLCFKSRMQIYDILEKLAKLSLSKDKISTVMRFYKKVIGTCEMIESAIEKDPAAVHRQFTDYVYTLLAYSPLELYLYYELCVSQKPVHFFFYGASHIWQMKKVLIESDGYEELMFYGMRCDDLHELMRIVQNKDSRDPGFHSTMLLHLEEVMGMTHEELWALDDRPKVHRAVRSKL